MPLPDCRCPRCGATLTLALVEACSQGALGPVQREVEQIVATMRRAIARSERKPGLSEETLHLMDHLGLKMEGALATLAQIEGRPVDREELRAAHRNGRRRHQQCRFCPD